MSLTQFEYRIALVIVCTCLGKDCVMFGGPKLEAHRVAVLGGYTVDRNNCCVATHLSPRCRRYCI